MWGRTSLYSCRQCSIIRWASERLADLLAFKNSSRS